MISFAQTLRRLRKNNNFTQSTVAEALGIDRSTYTYYESGKTKPDFESILSLCKLYGISISDMTQSFLADSNTTSVLNSMSKEYDSGERALDMDSLDDREKLMIIYYRKIENKDALFQKVKEFYDEEISHVTEAE